MAQTMLARGQRPTQHTTGAFLDALKRSRQADRCVSVYAEMMDSGVNLGDVCFNIVVSALVQVRATNNSFSLAVPPMPIDADCYLGLSKSAVGTAAGAQPRSYLELMAC